MDNDRIIVLRRTCVMAWSAVRAKQNDAQDVQSKCGRNSSTYEDSRGTETLRKILTAWTAEQKESNKRRSVKKNVNGTEDQKKESNRNIEGKKS